MIKSTIKKSKWGVTAQDSELTLSGPRGDSAHHPNPYTWPHAALLRSPGLRRCIVSVPRVECACAWHLAGGGHGGNGDGGGGEGDMGGKMSGGGARACGAGRGDARRCEGVHSPEC
jgi:hypothetical protein